MIEKIHNAPIETNDINRVEELTSMLHNSWDKILSAMDDDFNTPVVIADVITLLRNLN